MCIGYNICTHIECNETIAFKTMRSLPEDRMNTIWYIGKIVVAANEEVRKLFTNILRHYVLSSNIHRSYVPIPIYIQGDSHKIC